MNRPAMPQSNYTNDAAAAIDTCAMRAAPSLQVLRSDTASVHENLVTEKTTLLSTKRPYAVQSPKKTTTKKAVTFSPTSRCLVIPSRHDMTDAERNATWITAEEAAANQEDTIKTIRAAHRLAKTNGITPNDEVLCVRGLENVICGTKQRKLIQKQRDDLVRNVLLVQERHWQMGCDYADPIMLQAICETFSEDHVAWAIMLGESDAAYVRRRMLREQCARQLLDQTAISNVDTPL